MPERQQGTGRSSLYNRLDENDDQETEEVEINAPQLDYTRSVISEGTIDELPPAWEPEPSAWTVGYEPIGATSIGVEHERRSHSRRRGLQVKSTKLSDHNEGRHPSDGSQSSRLAELDKKRLTQTLCSRLHVGGLIQEEAVRAMLALDLRAFGVHKQIERVALAVICVITDYHRRYKRRDATAERLGSKPHFKKLAHEFGLANNHIQLSRKVKTELKSIGFFEPGAPGLNKYEPSSETGTIGSAIGKPFFRYNESITRRRDERDYSS